jgi:hypothetical protein
MILLNQNRNRHKRYHFHEKSRFGKIMRRVLDDKKLIQEALRKGRDLQELEKLGIHFATTKELQENRCTAYKYLL